MARALTLGAVAVAALCILGNCTDDSRDATDDEAAAAGPSTSAAATPSRSAEPSTHSAAPSPSTPEPPPLDIVGLRYVGDVPDEPDRPELPQLPAAGTVRAAVEVRGGWSGRFILDGGDPRVSVICSPQPNPRAGIDVYALNYMAISEAGTSEYGLPDGGWALRVTRIGPLGDTGDVEVSLTGVTADGAAWELPGYGTEAEANIVTAGPADNSAISFAYRGVARPQFSGDPDKITWVEVTGTVSCPAPLPDLTWSHD